MKPTTKRILETARLNRARIGGKRGTKAAAICYWRIKDRSKDLRRAIYLGAAQAPPDDDELF